MCCPRKKAPETGIPLLPWPSISSLRWTISRPPSSTVSATLRFRPSVQFETNPKILVLLREINQACNNLGIKWSLYGESAAWAKSKKRFIGSQCHIHIMMRAADALLLKSYLTTKNMPDRDFKDLSTNPRLPWNIIRYVDTSTTFMDKEDAVPYQLLGIAVIIHPLFCKKPDKIYIQTASSHWLLHSGRDHNGKPLSGKHRYFNEGMGNVKFLSQIEIRIHPGENEHGPMPSVLFETTKNQINAEGGMEPCPMQSYQSTSRP